VIDSHCHLDDSRFDADRPELLQRAAVVGVERYIVPAIHAESCKRVDRLSSQYESIYPAYGLHPWFCDRHREEDFELISGLLSSAVAVGECGLDFGLCKTDAATQLRWLRPQLDLALQFKLPVILHGYKSSEALIAEIKKQPGLRGVLHSYSGSLQQALQLIDLGFYIGLGGAITRPGAHKIHQLARQIPLEHILLETDAPDQSPYTQRGKRNEPAFLVEIAAQLARLRDIDTDQCVRICNTNAEELFTL